MIRTVYDLKLRIFDQLGDDPDAERFFSWSRILPYLQDGLNYARAACGDVWDQRTIPSVANQGEYQLPPQALEIVRLGWDDATLQERTRMYFDAYDWNWQARRGTPFEYTQDGYPQDTFRLYPKPEISTQEAVNFIVDPNLAGIAWPIASRGRLGRVLDADGTTRWTFQVDPALAGITWADKDFGTMLAGNFPVVGGNGRIAHFGQSVSDAITIWYVERAAALTDDSDEIPLAGPWRLSPMWYALSKVYEEDGTHHNSILGAYFRDIFLAAVGRMAARTRNPLPRIVHVMRPVGGRATLAGRRASDRYGARFPDRMTDPVGNTWELIW